MSFFTQLTGFFREGSWTPVITFATPGDLSVAYSVQEGRYRKIGSIVIVDYLIITTTFTHTTASGNMQLTGLPFTSSSATTIAGGGAGIFEGLTAAGGGYTQLVQTVGSGVTFMLFNANKFDGAAANLLAANTTSGTNIILQATVVYRASA